MGVLGVASFAGAPGVTTFSAMLAAAWPRAAVWLELADSGGSLITDGPGVRSTDLIGLLAASSSQSIDAATAVQDGQLPAISVPPSGLVARSAVAGYWGELDSLLRYSASDIIVDLGRLSPGSIGADLISALDSIAILCRPESDDLRRTFHGLAWVRKSVPTSLVSVGRGDYEPREIAHSFGVEQVYALPDDPRGAKAGRRIGASRYAHSRLGRDVKVLAGTFARSVQRVTLTPDLPPPPPPTPPPPPPTPPNSSIEARA